jgi:ribosome recycling factor
MSMLRAAAAARSSLRSAVLSKSISVAARPASLSPRILLQCRTYATKKQKEAKAAKGSTSKLVPGSKLVSSDPAVIEEYEKTEKKMQAAVDWFRREVANHETRATGRVTPALLSPVTVSIPSRKGETVRLEEVATVGVREGSTLLVTVFEEAVSKPATVFALAPVHLFHSCTPRLVEFEAR